MILAPWMGCECQPHGRGSIARVARLHARRFSLGWGLPAERALSLLPVIIRRGERERFHDVTTTVDSTLPVTDTHVFVM